MCAFTSFFRAPDDILYSYISFSYRKTIHGTNFLSYSEHVKQRLGGVFPYSISGIDYRLAADLRRASHCTGLGMTHDKYISIAGHHLDRVWKTEFQILKYSKFYSILKVQSTSPKSNLWGPHKSLRLRQNLSYSFVHICMFGIKVWGNEGWKYHDCILHGRNEKGREKMGEFMTSFWSSWQAGIQGQSNKISQEWQLRPFRLRIMI